MTDFPLVSVSCLTFNHARYLRECFDGFLMQKTNFSVEVLVHDDASTDQTKAIIEEYTRKHPTIFFPMHQLENQYSKGVRGIMAKFIFPRCRGKYVALCEGDDYWTDPYKLQKQVDFLEAHPDYVLSFHKVKILKPNGDLVPDFITHVPEDYETQETLARLGNYIHTPSVVFRNVLQEFPTEASLSPLGDYFLYMLLTAHGKLHYIQNEMAVYRAGVGIWSGQSDYFRNLKTAQTHALLVSALPTTSTVANILTSRVVSFLSRCYQEIKPADLAQLNTCAAIEKAIYSVLLNRNLNDSNAVGNYTTGQLLQVILERVKKRIWK